jgi:hypothetical protein
VSFFCCSRILFGLNPLKCSITLARPHVTSWVSLGLHHIPPRGLQRSGNEESVPQHIVVPCWPTHIWGWTNSNEFIHMKYVQHLQIVMCFLSDLSIGTADRRQWKFRRPL